MGVRRHNPNRILRTLGLILALAGAAASQPALAGGRLVAVSTTDLNGDRVEIPNRASARPTLVLLGFSHDHQNALQGWRTGLGLTEARPGWLEVPVIGVGGPIRSMILGGMRRKAATAAARAHLAPYFTDGAEYARRLQLDPRQPAVLVVGSSGDILAEAQGAYDPGKAAALARALDAP